MSFKTSPLACDRLRSGLCIDIPDGLSTSEESNDDSQTRTSKVQVRTGSTTNLSTGKQPVIIGPPTSSPSDMCSVTARQHISRKHLTLRSSTGMQGLLLAETGGGLVELDLLGGGSGFKEGTTVIPGLITPRGGASGEIHPPPTKVHSKSRAPYHNHVLRRHPTLLSQGVTHARNAAELKSLLGNSRAKVKSGAKLLPPLDLPHDASTNYISTPVSLEQGKSHARIEVDILLDREIFVEGSYLTGNLHVKIRNARAKEGPVLMAEGKIRLVGFEGIPENNDRHTFYQHAASLSTISSSSQVLYSSNPDDEGFSQVCEGRHIIPFSMKLPIGEGNRVGAKGPFDNNSGVVVRYIAIASFKLKDPSALKQSIAHFYRSCEIYPYFDSRTIMAPAIHPLLSTAARGVFLGGPGKLKLIATLHRNVWIAGQRCCVQIAVDNETKKSVKGLTLGLIRTITIFRPHPHLDVASPGSADPDACQTTTTRKLVAETILEVGQRGLRGHVTEKGWWMGVDPGVRTSFTHFILLPHDALSIVRSRLLEVDYAIRVSLTAGSLTSEVSTMLPLRIINHFSIDPPPSYTHDHPGVKAPAPPLPGPSLPNCCDDLLDLPALENTHSNQNWKIEAPVGQLMTIFNDLSTSGHVDASDVAIPSAEAIDNWSPASRMSRAMPILDEERPNIQNTAQARLFPRNDSCEDTGHPFVMGDDHSSSNDSDDMAEGFSIGEATLDLPGNLITKSEDGEANSVFGSAETKHGGHDLKGYTDLDVDDALDATVSAKELRVHECHGAGPENKPSRDRASEENLATSMYRPLVIRHRTSQKSTAVPDSSANRLNKLTLTSVAKSGQNFMSEAPKPGKNRPPLSAGQTAEGSWQKRTSFSQRVDRLVAAHHTSTASTTSATVSGVEITFFSADNIGTDLEPSMLGHGPTVQEHRLPPRNVVSGRPALALADSVSGSVRSRIAELEGRVSGVTTGSRPNLARVPGHFK